MSIVGQSFNGHTVSLIGDEGSIVTSRDTETPASINASVVGLLRASGGPIQVESVLLFPEALSDADIHRISTMPEAWTMENVSTPSMRVKQSGAVVRVAGMWTKRQGLLKPARLG